jgi:hypothetical protein
LPATAESLGQRRLSLACHGRRRPAERQRPGCRLPPVFAPPGINTNVFFVDFTTKKYLMIMSKTSVAGLLYDFLPSKNDVNVA